MSLRTVIVSLVLWLVCVAQAEEPQWLRDARAREGKVIAPVAFKSQDGWLSGRVPARVGDIVRRQDSYPIDLDIGADGPIQCEVVPGGFDMADRMRRTFESTMKRLEESQGKVEARQMEFTAAGAIGTVPYLQARWLFRVNDGKEARVGALKQLAFEKYGHGVYCAHLDLGFVNTFDTVVRAFAESFEAPPVAPPPYYFEIATASIDGRKSGVVVTRLERETDGKSKATQLMALMIAPAAGELRSQDALHIEWLKQDGSMIGGSQTVSVDGAVVTDVELDPVSDGWTVHGESEGQRLDDQLPADASPRTWVEQAYALRKLLASGNPIGVENNTTLWEPSNIAELTLTRTKVIAKAGADEFSTHVISGEVASGQTLDAKSGRPTSADIAIGKQVVRVERVFVSGSF
jgi:hypothetical protein